MKNKLLEELSQVESSLIQHKATCERCKSIKPCEAVTALIDAKEKAAYAFYRLLNGSQVT